MRDGQPGALLLEPAAGTRGAEVRRHLRRLCWLLGEDHPDEGGLLELAADDGSEGSPSSFGSPTPGSPRSPGSPRFGLDARSPLEEPLRAEDRCGSPLQGGDELEEATGGDEQRTADAAAIQDIEGQFTALLKEIAQVAHLLDGAHAEYESAELARLAKLQSQADALGRVISLLPGEPFGVTPAARARVLGHLASLQTQAAELAAAAWGRGAEVAAEMLDVAPERQAEVAAEELEGGRVAARGGRRAACWRRPEEPARPQALRGEPRPPLRVLGGIAAQPIAAALRPQGATADGGTAAGRELLREMRERTRALQSHAARVEALRDAVLAAAGQGAGSLEHAGLPLQPQEQQRATPVQQKLLQRQGAETALAAQGGEPQGKRAELPAAERAAEPLGQGGVRVAERAPARRWARLGRQGVPEQAREAAGVEPPELPREAQLPWGQLHSRLEAQLQGLRALAALASREDADEPARALTGGVVTTADHGGAPQHAGAGGLPDRAAPPAPGGGGLERPVERYDIGTPAADQLRELPPASLAPGEPAPCASSAPQEQLLRTSPGGVPVPSGAALGDGAVGSESAPGPRGTAGSQSGATHAPGAGQAQTLQAADSLPPEEEERLLREKQELLDRCRELEGRLLRKQLEQAATASRRRPGGRAPPAESPRGAPRGPRGPPREPPSPPPQQPVQQSPYLCGSPLESGAAFSPPQQQQQRAQSSYSWPGALEHRAQRLRQRLRQGESQKLAGLGTGVELEQPSLPLRDECAEEEEEAAPQHWACPGYADQAQLEERMLQQLLSRQAQFRRPAAGQLRFPPAVDVEFAEGSARGSSPPASPPSRDPPSAVAVRLVSPGSARGSSPPASPPARVPPSACALAGGSAALGPGSAHGSSPPASPPSRGSPSAVDVRLVDPGSARGSSPPASPPARGSPSAVALASGGAALSTGSPCGSSPPVWPLARGSPSAGALAGGGAVLSPGSVPGSSPLAFPPARGSPPPLPLPAQLAAEAALSESERAVLQWFRGGPGA